MEEKYEEINESLNNYTLSDFENDTYFDTKIIDQEFNDEVDSIKAFTYNEEYLQKIDAELEEKKNTLKLHVRNISNKMIDMFQDKEWLSNMIDDIKKHLNSTSYKEDYVNKCFNDLDEFVKTATEDDIYEFLLLSLPYFYDPKEFITKSGKKLNYVNGICLLIQFYVEEYGENIFNANNEINSVEKKLHIEKHKIFQLDDINELTKKHIYIQRKILANDKYYRNVNNFVKFYDELYNDHLPVFVTIDSFLHAWHKTFDNILIELEQTYMYFILKRLLKNTVKDMLVIKDFDQNIICDLIKYIEIAIKLLDGEGVRELNNIGNALFFGNNHTYDNTMMLPRGHYCKTEYLGKYFRAVSWLNIVKLYLVSDNDKISYINELKGILVLGFIMKKHMKYYKSLIELNSLFVGKSNDFNITHIWMLLEDLHINQINDINSVTIEQIRQLLLTDRYKIDIQINNTPTDMDSHDIMFSLFGQCSIIDSWALQKCVYNNTKELRIVPNSLDVIFSVFGNNFSRKEIIEKMKNINKDQSKLSQKNEGFDYHKELVSVRKVIDDIPEEYWNQSIYTMWIRLLKTLSSNSYEHVDPIFQTTEWKEQVINTQSSSYAELRHDTILLAAQTMRLTLSCGFPEAYIEPHLDFWIEFKKMLSNVNKKISQIEFIDEEFVMETSYFKKLMSHNSTKFISNITNCLNNFENTLDKIIDVVKIQLENGKIDGNELLWMNKMITSQTYGSGGQMEYLGWYPSLYYSHESELSDFEPVISDIYSSPKDDLDPEGSIIYIGTGCVVPMYIIIGDKTFCGPTHMFYEIVSTYGKRLTDKLWKNMLEKCRDED